MAGVNRETGERVLPTQWTDSAVDSFHSLIWSRTAEYLSIFPRSMSHRTSQPFARWRQACPDPSLHRSSSRQRDRAASTSSSNWSFISSLQYKRQEGYPAILTDRSRQCARRECGKRALGEFPGHGMCLSWRLRSRPACERSDFWIVKGGGNEGKDSI